VSSILRRGWCPSLYEPMATGDGLLVRVKPPNATLTADAARRLAAAAMQYGNGVIELTSRAGIQVRGLQQVSVGPFAAAMVAAGLADADQELERRRVVVVAPLAGPAVRAVAAQVELALCRNPRLVALPAKFAVAVEGDDALPLGDIGADIGVMCGVSACTVVLMATGMRVTVAAGEVPAIVTRFALTLLDQPMRRRPVPRPLKAVGWLSFGAFGLGFPFGTTAAATLASLADLAEAYGDGTLRATPWRACIIPDVSSAAIRAVREAGAALGLIVDPLDPRLAIVACPGRPACSSATVPARADAMRLAALSLPATVHVSGCAKGCAHPGSARITLVGENGRYGILRNGGPGERPAMRDLTIAQVITTLSA
jgi:precorrin-3B synthase